MPPRNGGLRKPTEEKALLAELAKMFHVAKAQHKEQHNVRRTPSPAAAAAAPTANKQPAKMSTRKPAKDTRRGSQRRSQQGGSIWMVLKGGFGPRSVPLATNAAVVRTRAQQRAVLSEKRRVAALKEAEAYVESAWQQAREGELVNSDGTPTEEGDAYLAEQYAAASLMLAPAPVGSFLNQLVETHSGGVADGKEKKPGEIPDFALTRGEWEDVCTREAAILFRYRTRATPSASAEDYFKEQQHAREQQYHFTTAEPTEGGGVDAAPTKCVVRLRDSQRNKHTAILSTAKAVNYFKSNIGQVLRKELAGSRLPRGGAEEPEGGATAGVASKGHQSVANTNASAAHSSKKKRKR
ncbi:hypothetical protein ABB37_08859 [Leptomonas pyrrhocoris]|uniref:Uncharacterized protein n=1 Tax=Leptomonas pyrrhocoris TaxID=157538 RepID=A0A0M9FS27_LEPPY|nr:hypothetical protein ABB37_08859 [Leptomonas pyrrhocoris]XP_015653277.1 hypothetical protein ABB37_08859 [Leptomonas pyrrhocoris]KPA74837.1 hypothetical protein ABB37_08859 [Leptomonas pyrrhocoris]KPA74838.1 hypothetical protein ABB37_08859 [Leptomonas pyrrhocoris]|eukprot:XP_015653276.1 hypothetical protein ABB37_08859 [Leptomonas pyrrhocoris]